MKTENSFKYEKMLKFTQFCNFYQVLGKILKTAPQAFEAGDFPLMIFTLCWIKDESSVL